MFDVQMRVFVGGARTVAQLPEIYSEAVHGRAGIGAADWEVLRSKDWWTPAQVDMASSAIDKVLSHSMKASNLPAFPMTAEYIAACIAVCVEPANWHAAAVAARAGLDGSQLIRPDGDLQQQRVMVTPERLFALICMYSGEVAGFRLGTPTAPAAKPK